MVQVVFEFPEAVLSARRKSPEVFGAEMRLTAAIVWYQQGELSQEEAAHVAGLSRRDFLAALAHRQIDVDETDLDQDEAKKQIFLQQVEAHKVHLPEDYSFNRDELYE